MSVLKVEELTTGYDKQIVSKDINFSVEAGDYLCIVGENGSGKSTLLKTILKLIPTKKGKISLNESNVGYLPQTTDIQKDFPASVEEIVLSGTLSNTKFPFYRKSDKKIANNNMAKLSIRDLKNKSYSSLSGGQQQRVLLARALCATENLLILDEPVKGLDPKVTKEMYKTIEELNESGMTIIMISHDMTSALCYAKKILHVGKKQLFFGNTEEYINSEVYNWFNSREEYTL